MAAVWLAAVLCPGFAVGQETSPDLWRDELQRGNQLRAEGRIPEARAALEAALAEAEKFGPNDVRVGVAVNALALLHHTQNNLGVAESLYARALSVLEQAVGREHPSLAKILSSQTDLYLALNRPEDARVAAERRIAMMPPDTDPFELVRALSQASMAEFLTANLVQAERYQARVIETLHANNAHVTPEAASGFSNIGMIYAMAKQYGPAMHRIEEALEIRRRLPEGGDLELAADLRQLADAYSKRMQYAEAERVLHQSLEVRRQAKPEAHLELAATLGELGRIYRAQQQLEPAERSLREALAMWLETAGPDQLDTTNALYDVALTLREQRRYQEAEPLLQRALQAFTAQLGADDEQVAQVSREYEEIRRLSRLGGAAESGISNTVSPPTQ